MRARAKVAITMAALASAAAVLSGAPPALAVASTCTGPTVAHTGQPAVTVTATALSPFYRFTDCNLSVSTGTTIRLAFGDAVAPHTLTSDAGEPQSFDLASNGATFRFAHAGTFAFHCSYHGDSFGMRGVLHVIGADVNGAPTASFTGPASAKIGASVTFDGSASSDPDAGDTLTYHWDLDGNAANGFERATTTATVKTSYATAGKRTVRLQVTDNHGAGSNIATRAIDVSASGGSFSGVALLHRTIR